MGETPDTRLTLVTFHPFDAFRPGGPLPYVVTALADAPAQGAPSNVTDSAYTSVLPASRSTSGEPSGARPLQTP